jgi:L-cysteine:1D-myo-inositol 2-amino-2-deoxy-alpha-D-glucopyranoside ligase
MLAWPDLHLPELPSGLQLPGMRLFHSYRNELVAIEGSGPFTMYVCGITPYDSTHLGHAATFLTFDLIHRFLKASGRQVEFLENVTDIDDPLFDRARRDQVSWKNLGSEQLRLFISDMSNLRMIPPIQLVTVTETMPRIIEFVAALKEKGLSYQIQGDTYLDGSEAAGFADLPVPVAEAIEIFAERGGDPYREGKRHPLDPLLWRRSASDEPEWESDFGPGRPGWHVECNAISSLLLDGGGQTLSLQGGGSDLRFPHHYMTALQGRAATGVEFAALYVHAGMIGYEGQKMSKSLGNLVFVSDLVARGIHPMAIRTALMMGHYRMDREWSAELLREAETLIEGLLRVLAREWVPSSQDLMQKILNALADDLDTGEVLSLLRQYIERVDSSNPTSDSDKTSEQERPGKLARFLDTVLGIAL